MLNNLPETVPLLPTSAVLSPKEILPPLLPQNSNVPFPIVPVEPESSFGAVTFSINKAMRSEEKEEVRPGEQAMWRAVIAQAILDATSGSKKGIDRAERARAIAWLSGRSEDFVTVCALAGLSPTYVIEKARQALKDTSRWRKTNTKSISIKNPPPSA